MDILDNPDFLNHMQVDDLELSKSCDKRTTNENVISSLLGVLNQEKRQSLIYSFLGFYNKHLNDQSVVSIVGHLTNEKDRWHTQ